MIGTKLRLYKAWIVEEKKIFDVKGLYFGEDIRRMSVEVWYPTRKECLSGKWFRNYLDKVPKFILLQFTGLYDKNNIPIYEGDIIKRNTGIFIIEWYKENATFYANWIKNEYADFCFCDDICSCEIIGHELTNPELLEKL